MTAAPSPTSVAQPAGGVFYGWRIVAALFLCLAITSGLGFYNASVILGVAKDELGVSVRSVSGATTMFFGVSGVVGYALAKRMDQVDIRWFYVAGGVIGAASLVGLRWVDSAIDLYIFFSIFGVAFAIAGLVPSTTLVARWFDRRRSVALSIASTGLSFGGIAITPFVARAFEANSLASVGPWLGLVWIIGVIPVTWFVVRSWPSDKGLHPDGAVYEADVAPPAVLGATFAQAKSARFYRLLCAVYALIFLAQVGGIAHMYNLVKGREDTGLAAAAVSVLALSSVLGRLTGGALVTKVSSQRMTAVLVLVQGFALAFIGIVDGREAMLVGAAIFGVSIGNLLMLQPLLLAETYGVREYSRIYSFSQLFGTIGVAGGPFVVGLLQSLFDYRAAFVSMAFANMLGFGLLVMAGSTVAARAEWESPVS